jgi:hypothetical protein
MKVEISKLKIEAAHPCGCYMGFDKELSPILIFVPCGRTEHHTQGNCNELIDGMKRQLGFALDAIPIPRVKPLMSY